MSDFQNMLVFISTITTIISLSITFLALRPLWQNRFEHPSTLDRFLTKDQVDRAVRYYVEPMCQDLDPAGGEEPRLVFGVRQKLFQVLDAVLNHPTEFRYVFLLADSGMGKSSALINYYARHIKRWRRAFEIELVPLGIPNAVENISAIPDKSSKVLFLDAFDEDTLAIVDHLERLRTLLEVTQEFRRVLITCRTQFFSEDEEIPVRTGVIKVGARGPAEPREYFFHKIYLSPFGDEEIKRFVRRRYPLWSLKKRAKVNQMAARIPNLAVRPMLLAYTEDLVRTGKELITSLELYEEMVNAWLRREEGFIASKEDLRLFSELLAWEIYTQRAERGGERISEEEVVRLSKSWGVPLEPWALTGRSLLNRDATGNFKFAHRSIMEYLVAVALMRMESPLSQIPWSNQISDFIREGVDLGIPGAFRAAANSNDEEIKSYALAKYQSYTKGARS